MGEEGSAKAAAGGPVAAGSFAFQVLGMDLARGQCLYDQPLFRGLHNDFTDLVSLQP